MTAPRVRALAASLVGFAILFSGIPVVVHGGRASDLTWFILVFLFCQYVAFRLLRRATLAQEDERLALARAKHEKKTAERQQATGPVLGKLCAVCTRRIVFEDDGSRCKECLLPVHHECRSQHEGSAHQAGVGAYR